jgi:hypothetical protein
MNKFAVEFLELGTDSVLSFKMKDFEALQGALGEGYFRDAVQHMDALDLKWIEAFLRHGGKTAAGVPKPIKLEEVDEIPLSEIATRCLDALYLKTTGRKYKDHVLWRLQENGELETLVKRLVTAKPEVVE